MCILGVALATDGVKPLRQTLHGTLAHVAPTTIKKAVVVSMSEGASHFQKLPGKQRSNQGNKFSKSEILKTSQFLPLQRVRSSWQGMLT